MRFERLQIKQLKYEAKEDSRRGEQSQRNGHAIDQDFHGLVEEFEQEMRATEKAASPPKPPPAAGSWEEDEGTEDEAEFEAEAVQEQKESVHRVIRELMARGDAYADFMHRLCHEVAAMPLESHYVRAECLTFFAGVRNHHRKQSQRKVEISSPAGVALLSTADVCVSVETLGGGDATDLDTEVETEAVDTDGGESVLSADEGYAESGGERYAGSVGDQSDASSRLGFETEEDETDEDRSQEQMSSQSSELSHTNYFIQNLAANPLISPNMKGQQMRQAREQGHHSFDFRSTGMGSSVASAGSSGIARRASRLSLEGTTDDDADDDADDRPDDRSNRSTAEDGNEFEGFTSASEYTYNSYGVGGSQRDEDFEDDRSQTTDAEWRNIYEPSETGNEFTGSLTRDDDLDGLEFTTGDENENEDEGRYDYAESLGTSQDTAASVPTSAMESQDEDGEFGFGGGSIGGGAYEADSDTGDGVSLGGVGMERGVYDNDSDVGDQRRSGDAAAGDGPVWDDTSSAGGTYFTDTSGGTNNGRGGNEGDEDEDYGDSDNTDNLSVPMNESSVGDIDSTTFSDTVTDTSGDADSETHRRHQRRIAPIMGHDSREVDSEYGMEESQVAPEPRGVYSGARDLQVADESMLPPAHRQPNLDRKDSEFGMEAFQVADEWMLQRPGTSTWPPTRGRDLQVADESMLPPSHREAMLRQRTDEFGLEAFQVADESMLDAGRLQENADITSTSEDYNSTSSTGTGDGRVPQHVLYQQQAMAAGRPKTARGSRRDDTGLGDAPGTPPRGTPKDPHPSPSIDSEFGLEDFQVSDDPKRPRLDRRPSEKYDESVSVASSEQNEGRLSVASSEQNVDPAAVVVPLGVRPTHQQQERWQQQRIERRRQRQAETAAALGASAGSSTGGSPRSSPLQPVVHLLQHLIQRMGDECGADALFDKEMLLEACDQVVAALRRVLLGVGSDDDEDTEDEAQRGEGRSRKMMVDHHLRSTLRRAFLKFRARPITLAKRELVQRASDILHDEMTFASVLDKLDVSFENEIAALRNSARARSASASALRSGERQLLQQRQDAVEELLLERQQRLGRADDYAQPRSTPITKAEREEIRRAGSPLSKSSLSASNGGFANGRNGRQQEQEQQQQQQQEEGEDDSSWQYPQDEPSSSEPEETQPSEMSDSDDEFDYGIEMGEGTVPEKSKKLDQSVETFRQLRENFKSKMDELSQLTAKPAKPGKAQQPESHNLSSSAPSRDGNYKDFKQIFGFSPAAFSNSTGPSAKVNNDGERVESLSAQRVPRGSPRNGAVGMQNNSLSPSAQKYIVYDESDQGDESEHGGGVQRAAGDDGFTDLGILGMDSADDRTTTLGDSDLDTIDSDVGGGGGGGDGRGGGGGGGGGGGMQGDERVDLLGISGDGMAAQMQGMLQQMQSMILQQQEFDQANAYGEGDYDKADGGAITMHDLPTSADKSHQQKAQRGQRGQARRSPGSVAATRQQLMVGLKDLVSSASSGGGSGGARNKWNGASSAPAVGASGGRGTAGVHGIDAALSGWADEQGFDEQKAGANSARIADRLAKAKAKQNGQAASQRNGASAGLTAGGVVDMGASQYGVLKHQFESEQVLNSESMPPVTSPIHRLLSSVLLCISFVSCRGSSIWSIPKRRRSARMVARREFSGRAPRRVREVPMADPGMGPKRW
jgi:hypothetical protein